MTRERSSNATQPVEKEVHGDCTELIAVTRPSDLEAMWNKYEEDMAAHEQGKVQEEEEEEQENEEEEQEHDEEEEEPQSPTLERTTSKQEDEKSAGTLSTIPSSTEEV